MQDVWFWNASAVYAIFQQSQLQVFNCKWNLRDVHIKQKIIETKEDIDLGRGKTDQLQWRKITMRALYKEILTNVNKSASSH